MSTAKDIVLDALMLAGAHTVVNPAPVESQNRFFTSLVKMLAKWEADGICLCCLNDIVDINTELGEPDWATVGLSANLAVYAAPFIQRPVPAFVRELARGEYNTIVGISAPPVDARLPSSLPIGAGNQWEPRSRTYYPEPDTTLTNCGVDPCDTPPVV